jgi:hypothetical protein
MKRMYVVMRGHVSCGERIEEPYDVVSSATKAEEIATLEEERSNLHNDKWYYFWREIISSEN